MLVTERTAGLVLEKVAHCDNLVIDTETNGLGVWTGDRIVGVAVKAGGEGYYFPFRHGAGPNLSGERLSQLVKALRGKRLRGFHLRFDLEMLHNEGLPMPPQIEDTLIAAILMNENEPSFALKRARSGDPGLSIRHLGKDAVWADDALTQKMQTHGLTKGTMWKLPAEDVAEYACGDLDLPERLMEEIYRPALQRWGLEGLFADYNNYQRLLIGMEIQGIPVDRTLVDQELASGSDAREALLWEIRQGAGYPLNPNSPKQVSAACSIANAQETTLRASGHPLADLILDYKAYTKRDSTYLQRFIDYSCSRGLLHPQLNLTPNEQGDGGTRSSRLSCSKPNLQAMPKPKTNIIYAPCRAAIHAPPGYSILEADYSQAEVRIAGHYSQEPAFFDIFSVGRDVYQELAEECRWLVPGFDRQSSKILHLAIQYGAGVWKVAEMLGIQEDKARALRNAWHARFPRVSLIMRTLQRLAEKDGCIRLPEGRFAHFDGARKGVHCKSPYYTAWNRLVQGSVAGMIRVAMMRLAEPIDWLSSRMLLQVHDSILFLVPTHKIPAVCAVIRQEMENFPHWDIRPKVDIKAGPTWLDVKEIA